MKRIIFLFFVFVLYACANQPSEGDIQTAIAHTQEAQPTNTISPTKPPVTPTTTIEPACAGDICIKNVYLQIGEEDYLLIDFDLVDNKFQVDVTKPPKLTTEIMFALFIDDSTTEGEFLIAMEPDLSLYSCYTGNDIPWTSNRLASVCGIAVPLNLLEVRIKEGDPVIAEILRPVFRREIIWVDSKR